MLEGSSGILSELFEKKKITGSRRRLKRLCGGQRGGRSQHLLFHGPLLVQSSMCHSKFTSP